MDNSKMIAYRAETSMYWLIKRQMNKHHNDEGRKLLQQVYRSDADIIPDYENKILRVNFHHLNHRKDDKRVTWLCEKLNEIETELSGTNLKIIYELVSS